MNTSKKKKAFTLTELLVVIVIAGVLAAVALPKFNAVVETRRTGEAEELASAIRNEQERRCALDQNYTVNPSRVSVAGTQTANRKFAKGSFEYELNSEGLVARRTDKDYKLVMPSYKDGRMYCEGEYCDKLNKNYARSQAELTDFRAADECAAPIGEEGGQTACEQDPNSCECNPNQAKCCASDEYWNGTKCVKDTPCNRDPESCECNPNQAKCCKEGEVWENGKCVVPEKKCQDEGSRVRCMGGHVPGNWDTETCTCTCPDKYVMNEEGECVSQCENRTDRYAKCETDYAVDGVIGTWSDASCSCTCPAGWELNDKGSCDCPKGQKFNYDTYKCEERCATAISQGHKSRCESIGRLGVKGTWNDEYCRCDCPDGYAVDAHEGTCELPCDYVYRTFGYQGELESERCSDDPGDCDPNSKRTIAWVGNICVDCSRVSDGVDFAVVTSTGGCQGIRYDQDDPRDYDCEDFGTPLSGECDGWKDEWQQDMDNWQEEQDAARDDYWEDVWDDYYDYDYDYY